MLYTRGRQPFVVGGKKRNLFCWGPYRTCHQLIFLPISFKIFLMTFFAPQDFLPILRCPLKYISCPLKKFYPPYTFASYAQYCWFNETIKVFTKVQKGHIWPAGHRLATPVIYHMISDKGYIPSFPLPPVPSTDPLPWTRRFFPVWDLNLTLIFWAKPWLGGVGLGG